MPVDFVTDFIRGTDSRRTLNVVSAAAPEFNADIHSALNLTALAVPVTGITFTGDPVELQEFVIRIKDNGVARALAFGPAFEAVGATLPTTTVAGKRHTLTFVYDPVTAKFGLIDAKVEA